MSKKNKLTFDTPHTQNPFASLVELKEECSEVIEENSDTLEPILLVDIREKLSRRQCHIRIEKHHRGGKTVTIVSGFNGSDEELQVLAKELKNRCATGGTVKDGEIVLQGEIKDKVLKLLK